MAILDTDEDKKIKTLFVKYMAWNILPILYNDALSRLCKMGFSPAKAVLFLKSMQENGEMEITSSQYNHGNRKCRLLPGIHLKYLWLIRNESCEEFEKEQPKPGYVELQMGALRNAMLHWAATGNLDDDIIIHWPVDELTLPLFREMAYSTEWRDLYCRLSVAALFSIIDRDADCWNYRLKKVDESFVENLYIKNESMPSFVKEYFQEAYSFYEYVLSGRINEIPENVSTRSAVGLCAHALHAQYHGNYSKALKIYGQALKYLESRYLFDTPFYSLMYVIALMREGSAASKKKMDGLVTKKRIREERQWLPAYLMLLIALGRDTKELVLWIERNYELQSNMVKALLYLLLEHYKLNEKICIDNRPIEKLLEDDCFKALQLEYSCDFVGFSLKNARLREEMGVEPLLPVYVKREPWEMALDRLAEMARSQEAGETAKGAVGGIAQVRIVYHITSHGQIIPRLQKSKDGITWTGGRNIALSTFQQNAVEGMSALDKSLSACVEHYNAGYSLGDIYELGGPKALSLLVGYPFVYMAENPDLPVVITKEELQLVVTQLEDGYQVNSNVGRPESSDLILKKENDQLFRIVELNREQRSILEILKQSSRFPLKAKDRLAEVLGKLGKNVTIHSDLIRNKGTLKQIKGDSLITVQLLPVGDGIKVELFVKPFTEQPPYCKAGKGVGSVIGTVKGEHVQAVRDLEKERENYVVVNRILRRISGNPTVRDTVYFEDYYQCLDLIEELRGLSDVSRSEWPEGTKLSIKGVADFPQLKLSMKGMEHWFEIGGELEIEDGGRIKIAELLKKVRESKGRFIALNDSDFLALSSQLRRRLQELDAILMNDKSMKVAGFNAALLVDLEQQGVVLKKDRKFKELQQKIEKAETVQAVVPATLQAELRDYQMEGFQWLSRLAHWGAGACLADDMGLGKTIQAIALMLSRGKQGASLVVAPASVLFNWQSEINRFAPSLTCRVLHDSCGNREQMIQEVGACDILLTTYGLLNAEVVLLSNKQWNVILLDEAHTIKNKDTKISKAAMQLNGEFRLLLTGTPIQNHLSEIWNLFEFANPGLLGTFPHFFQKFILPIEKSGDKQRQEQLKKILQPFLLRRTKTEVLDELPPKTEIVQKVELSSEEMALYEHLRQQAIANIEEGSSSPVRTLAEITRLRQAACHPALVNEGFNKLASSKTKVFMGLVDDLIGNQHRALVFSQFTSHLALIRKELDSKGISCLYLDGTMSVNEREKQVSRFQQGEGHLFLISLKAGGTGLNLTAADYVIHLDPWWNPAAEDQASDRAHRIGQTRPVTIYRLISSNTIEEKIVLLHQSKKSLADSLLDGSNMAHKLTKEEMLELLRGGI